MQCRQQTPRFKNSWVAWLGLVLSCGIFSGCGGGDPNSKITGNVTITITNGGAPVTSGRVELETDRPGEGSGADLDSSGVAKITGATVGEYTVVVRPAAAVQVPGMPAPPKADPLMFLEKFRARKSSPLKIQVDEGANAQTFDLKEAK